MIVEYKTNLLEHLSHETVKPSFNFLVEDEVNMFTGETEKKKNLYFQGVFCQSEKLNFNGRIYPESEIRNAVKTIMQKIEDPDNGGPQIAELDHPTELTVNLDRSAGLITKMWMEGKNGMGRMKIISTPMGNIVRTLVLEKVRLGVSTRGIGNVDDKGYVSDFEIVTVDIVANPSCKSATPRAFFETMETKRAKMIQTLAESVNHDPKAQNYLKKELMEAIKRLH